MASAIPTTATSLTWAGGGGNLASDPTDWSPAVAPAPGDTLTMALGTMNLVDNALAGNTLTVPASSTVSIATSNAASLNLIMEPSGATAHIGVAPGSTLTLNAQVTRGTLDTSGGAIKFIGSNAFSAFSTVFDNNLTGTATLNLTGGNASGELMEVNGSVGRGLTFNLSGGAPDASLQIDKPTQFRGLIDLTTAPVGVGHVGFAGIHATSAYLFNGILSMFDNQKLVDVTRVGGGTDLQLHQTATGVNLTSGAFSDIPAADQGTVIPLHKLSV